MRILILARRFRSNQSEADEHDFIYNKLTLKKIEKNSNSISIKYDLMKNYKKYINWKPTYVIYLGFDPIVLDIKDFLKIQNLQYGQNVILHLLKKNSNNFIMA